MMQRRFSLACLLCLSLAPVAAGQDLLDRATQRMQEAVQRLTVPTALMTNGPHVHEAFKPVIQDAAEATVRIKCDGKDAALGIVAGPDGWILTKASQLEGSDVVCLLPDGRKLPADVAGIHPGHDLAMLRIDARRLPAAPWSKSAPAVGNWLASPGPNGKPLAVSVLGTEARQIPKEGGVLGIILEQGDGGPLIVQVVPDSGAAAAGLQVNDIVTHCDDRRTADRRQLVLAVRSHGPGETVELRVRRGEQKLKLTATLTRSLKGWEKSRREVQNTMGSQLSRRRDGFPMALQHGGVISPTDCGGPLVDLNGEVVGINISRTGRTETYAVPSNVLLTLMYDLMSGNLRPEKSSGR